MTFKDWDEALKFLVVLTKWPPIVLLIALIFRRAIASKIASLKQITIKEKAEIVFEALGELKKVAAKTSPKLFQQFVLKLPHSAITEGEAEADDDTKDKDAEEADTKETQDQDVDDEGADESAEADRVELETQLKSLTNKREED